MAAALRDLLRAPFVVLLVIDLLVFGALMSMDQIDGAAQLNTLLLAVVSAYVQIALTMAAGSRSSRSADEWVKLAFRRRVFWRFALTNIVTLTLILAGFFLLIVGGLVLGALLALSQPASIQQRAWPLAAIRTSIAMSEGNRVPLGVLFGVLYALPTLLLQLGASLAGEGSLSGAWTVVGALGTAAGVAGVIALTRAYVSLGGKPTELPSTSPLG